MSEVKLLPCPFCGSDVNDDDSGHGESCYFSAQENFENSCGGDITVVLDAWNKRPDYDAQRLRADTAEAELEVVRKSRNDELENYNALIADHAAAEQRIASHESILRRFANCADVRQVGTLAMDYVAALNQKSEGESHE